MKSTNTRNFLLLTGLLLMAGALATQADNFFKSSTTDNLNVGTSWTNGVNVPGGSDVAWWDSNVTNANTTATGAPLAFGQVKITNPGGNISIVDATTANILTISNTIGGVGIDMSASTRNLTIGSPLLVGGDQAWNINSARNVSLNGVNGLAISNNVLTILAGGTLNVNYSSTPTLISSSSGSGLVLSNSSVSMAAVNNGSVGNTGLFFGTNIALTLFGNSKVTVTGPSSTGNKIQNFTNLTMNAGSDILTAGTRGSSSGLSVGFAAVSRNAGSMTDTPGSGGATGFGGSNQGYGFPGSTVLGYVTTAGNDWTLARGAATYTAAATYSNDVFTTSTADVTVTVNDAPATFTINSLRFNTAGARTLTLAGANTITTGGILAGSTVGANAATIAGGTLTSGNTNADGTHDLIVINNNSTAGSAGNIVINSVITDNGAFSVGLTAGSTLATTPTGSIQLGTANTFSGTTIVTKGILQLNNSLALQNSTFDTSQAGTLSFGSLTAATFAGISGPGNLALPANFALTVGNNNSSSTFSGAMSGAGATVAKVGSGTFTLNGANAYSGNTTVSNGVLALGAAASLNGGVSIVSGATVDVSAAGNYSLTKSVSGSGTINGSLTLAGGGQLSPAGTSGVLTLNNDLTLNGGTCLINVDASTPTNGMITIGAGGAGNLTVNSGTIQLNITGGTLANGTYKIINVPNGTATGVGTVLSVSGFSQLNQAAAMVVGTHELDLVVFPFVVQNLVWLGDGSANLWNVSNAPNWNDVGPNPANPAIFLNGDKTILDNSSANTTVNLAGTLSPASVTVNGSQSYTLVGTGKISGSTSLADNSSGTLTILTTNDYAGGTVIASGATVQVGDGVTAGGSIGSGPVTNSSALVFDLPGTSSQPIGAVSGSGTLTTIGNGTLILNGVDTLAGNTTITAGSIKQGVANVLPNGSGKGDMVVNGTLGMGGQNGTVNGLTGGGTIDNTLAGNPVLTVLGSAAANPSVFGGVIQNTVGSVALTMNGSGKTLELTGTNTYSGGTVITAGTLQLGSPGAIPGGNLSGSAGGILDLNGFSATVNGLSGNFKIDNVAGAGTNTLSIGNGDGGGTFSGTITNTSGAVNLVKNGGGTVIFNSANGYSGTTTVNASVLQLNAGGSLINGGGVTLAANNNDQFVINGGSITVAAFNINNPSVGLLMSSGSASIQGGLTLNALGSEASTGSLIALLAGSLFADSLTTGRGGLSDTTQPTAGITTEGLYINGATVYVTNNVGIGSPAGANSSANARIDSGSMTVGGSLTVGLNNTGRWSLMDVNGGNLMVNDTNTGISLGSASAGNEILIIRSTNSTVTAGAITLAPAQAQVVISLTAGSLYIGSGGITNPASVPSFIGLGGGVLGATNDWSSAVAMSLTNTLIKAADAAGVPHNILLSGAISGPGNLLKTGGGILDLSGPSTYTGTTTVSNGTLLVDSPVGTSGTSSGAVIVLTNATLGGGGYIGGNVTLNNGAHTLPGGTNTTGFTNTVVGNLTYNTGAEADFYAGTVYNSGNDQIVVNGTLTGTNLNVGIKFTGGSGVNMDTSGYYTLFQLGGPLATTFNPAPVWIGTPPANSNLFAVEVIGNNVVLSGSPIVITSAAATPNVAGHGQVVNFTVNATAGIYTIDPNTGVHIDASQIVSGLTSLFLVQSNGTSLYTNSIVVPSNPTFGQFALTYTVTDSHGDSLSPTISLTIGGAPDVWNGNASPDNKWNNVLNWANGFVPVPADLVIFAGNNQLQPNMESPYSVTSVTFSNNAGSFNITNDGTSALTVTGGVLNNSANTETLSVPVALSGVPTFNAAAGNITLSNLVSDGVVGSGLTKTGSNTLTLAFAGNTYTGPTTINNGLLVFAGDNGAISGAMTNNARLQLNSIGAIASVPLVLNNGSTLQLRADADSSFQLASLALQNAPSTLGFDVGPLTGGTGHILTLPYPMAFVNSSSQTINVSGNSTYTMGLSDITTVTTSHTPYFSFNINTLPAGAVVVIPSFMTGNFGNYLNAKGGGNVTITGNLGNTSNGSINVFVNDGTTLTLQGSTVKSGTGDAYRYDVVNGTLVLDSSSALINNSTAAGLNQSFFILGAATNIYTGTGFSPAAGVLIATNNSFNATVYLSDANNFVGGGMATSAILTNNVSDGDVGFTNNGVFTIGGQNTSGINTYANPIILGLTANRGKSVTLVAATGGEVDFTGNILRNGTDTTAGITAGDAAHHGLVKLTGTNTYGGSTIVNAGTLDIALPNLATNSTVTVASGAVLQLDFTVTNTVAFLVLSGVSKPAGTYNSGNTALITGTGSLLVVPPAPPVAGVTNLTTTVGAAPLSVTFTNLSINATSYLWSFGDGGTLATSSGTNVTHSYVTPGTYTNILTAFGAGGTNSATNVNAIVVSVALPVANFSGSPTNIFVTQAVVFTNTSTGSLTNSAWTFGDGNVANLSGASVSNNVSNIYSNAGTYPVTLIVKSAGGSSTNTKAGYITVLPKLTLSKPILSNGSLILSNATGGIAGVQYRILSTNTLPGGTGTVVWPAVYTNVFGPGGSYSYTNTPLTNAASFFQMVSP